MTDSLKSRIDEDMKSAMRAKEQLRLSVIRMLRAAIKQREIDEKITLGDNDVMNVLNKMIKQRRESIKQYEQANRKELAEKEQQEIGMLEIYLPAQLSESEIESAIKEAISSTGASSIKDMGKVMGVLKDKLANQADMGKVGAMVKSLLG